MKKWSEEKKVKCVCVKRKRCHEGGINLAMKAEEK